MTTDKNTASAHGEDCSCGRSRRNVLSMAGVGVIGAGLLAACGGGTDTSGSAATATGTAPTGTGPTSTAPTSVAATTAVPTTVPTTAAPTAAPTTAAPATAAPTAAGFTVKTTDIPVGSGKIYDAQKLVVTQPTAGQFKAFSAVCPHQGCNVAAIENRQIQCPCHASLFDLSTGARISGPAPTGLSTEKLTVAGGTITVAV